MSVGGNSEPSLRVAAAQADEWCTAGGTVKELQQRLSHLDTLARRASRSPQDIARSVMNGMLVGRDAAELERRAVRLAALIPQLVCQARRRPCSGGPVYC